MGEPGRIQAFLGWWRELPTAWRVNAGLYALAGVSLIALLTQIVIGGDSRSGRVEVAARAPRPTIAAAAPSTTEPPPTTEPPTTVPPAAADQPSPATTRARGGARAGGGSPPPVAFTPTPTTILCHNSVDPACGEFRWDPPPGDNAGLQISISRSPEVPKVGEEVTFTATVTDPDHIVTGNCTEVRGATSSLPCTPPPCPARYGPWQPPARHGQTRTFSFRATYSTPGLKEASFTFHTDLDMCRDPYGSVGTERVTVDVAPAAQPESPGT
jgi:hypothetical protein